MVDIDLTLDATEEAQICLNCNKTKCRPTNCKRLKERLKELKKKEQIRGNNNARNNKEC